MTEDLKEEIFDFLDYLRESGATNMFGAGRYITDMYPEVSRKESHELLKEWMETFNERHPQ
jgi:hypothetical protein